MIFALQAIVIALPANAAEKEIGSVNQSRMLKTKGNKIVLAEDESVEVTLVGLNVLIMLKDTKIWSAAQGF